MYVYASRRQITPPLDAKLTREKSGVKGVKPDSPGGDAIGPSAAWKGKGPFLPAAGA